MKKILLPLLFFMGPILNAQNLIEENLGLRVSIINKKNNSGKVTISYENLEQFELISNLLKKR